MTKPRFKGKYRVESTRLPNRNYAANGWYFVTICTGDRSPFFGNINTSQVQLSAIGEIAQKFWADIPKHFHYTYIDAYVIMPNHVHGIVIIDRPADVVKIHDNGNVETRHMNVDTQYMNIDTRHMNVETRHINIETRHMNVETRYMNVETRNFASLQQPTDESNKFGPLKPGSLQAIIHAYKSAVTRWCRQNGHDNFRWQPRFYEHIIRADESLDRIRQYIADNPAKWELDKDNPANLWM
ncbi:MAG: transposase [Nostocaceae cyanobacterium]|nr:transposase [Nostocaceae cyanobacterium]